MTRVPGRPRIRRHGLCWPVRVRSIKRYGTRWTRDMNIHMGLAGLYGLAALYEVAATPDDALEYHRLVRNSQRWQCIVVCCVSQAWWRRGRRRNVAQRGRLIRNADIDPAIRWKAVGRSANAFHRDLCVEDPAERLVIVPVDVFTLEAEHGSARSVVDVRRGILRAGAAATCGAQHQQRDPRSGHGTSGEHVPPDFHELGGQATR